VSHGAWLPWLKANADARGFEDRSPASRLMAVTRIWSASAGHHAAREHEPDAKGERTIWLAPNVLDKLKALRGPGESYSDLILRLAKIETGKRP
jgi:hypothetical protein